MCSFGLNFCHFSEASLLIGRTVGRVKFDSVLRSVGSNDRALNQMKRTINRASWFDVLTVSYRLYLFNGVT